MRFGRDTIDLGSVVTAMEGGFRAYVATQDGRTWRVRRLPFGWHVAYRTRSRVIARETLW